MSADPVSPPVRLAVHGAAGRMGLRLVALSRETEGLELVAGIERAGHPRLGEDLGVLAGAGSAGVALSADLGAALASADVLIDFSSPAAVAAVAAACREAGKALVVGTTGLDDGASRALDEAASRVAVLVAANMSPGIALLARLVTEAVRALGSDYDVEVLEMHHRGKADAPSGTALRLVEAARAGRTGGALRAVHGRSGQLGARTPDEIGVLALRGGDVVGDHTVVLAGPGERIELTHRASSRDLFARGALRASRWIVGRPPGRYRLEDTL